MKLKYLLEGVETVRMDADVETEISDIKIDSRDVSAGDMFICLDGCEHDGHTYVRSIEKKAAVIIAEKEIAAAAPVVVVKDTRAAYSIISQNYFSNPAKAMKLIAIVGTNGKTSTAHILENILSFAGMNVGVTGTIGHSYGGVTEEADLTTPDPYKFNSLLKKMRDCGVEVVISEVSAHAIALKKLHGIVADMAILTNVTQDHLDYFKTFKEYAETKLGYFNPRSVRLGLVNMDDEWGRKLAARESVPMITYGMDNPADVFAIEVNPGIDGVSFVMNVFDEILEISSPLYGYFNVYNLMTAITAAKLLSVPSDIIVKAVRRIKEVEGRFNIIKNNKGIVIIDYAHTPDGLQNILSSARIITKGQLITVFGCGGNRDKTKRPLMGGIASKLSDYVIVTSDNPRFEEPIEIMKDIEAGLSGRYKMIQNRAEAITCALSEMSEGDTVVIAGKGAEKYIEIKGEKKRYSDFDVVRRTKS
ncbi:MAG: UDP-N-acetylmuramoyl-L-alanyl-D-glutamate--2,6-diaminopimelate ligase [Clostridiaceae bacterium]|nr:UDP-N-acetylmuramoyl-L-alanyl-D-glutamate--2,6-diaminopimelate ligase [Clostridiaceae bacterium]